MAGLREKLLQEQNRLERIIRRTEEQLKEVPCGILRLSGCGKSIQYYHCMPGEKKKGEYIPKKNEVLALCFYPFPLLI